MSSIVLYLAVSIDGFIADKNGKVDWLKGESEDVQDDTSYEDFYQTIDTILMGYHTYNQIVTELSPNKWVYSEKMTYVLTHKKQQSPLECIQFIQEPLESLLQRLKQNSSQDIWICGGAEIAQQCLEKNFIDKLHLTVIPTLLGQGIRLFGALDKPQIFSLVSVSSKNLSLIHISEPTRP